MYFNFYAEVEHLCYWLKIRVFFFFCAVLHKGRLLKHTLQVNIWQFIHIA